MAEERAIQIDTDATTQAGKRIVFAGEDLADLHRDIGRMIRQLSAGPPWSMDKIGKQVEVGDGAENKGYRINEDEVLKAWATVAQAIENLGVNVQNAVATIVNADVVSSVNVESVRQPGTNTSRL
ncbi:hypothetical protein [Catellatospora sp. NPDC049111]|jgi:hypothetical protein|uniref:hypothetical protein n=1 Tax=unclassified Catellatospora TaxID=2645785 RepID=UPI0033C0B7FD